MSSPTPPLRPEADSGLWSWEEIDQLFDGLAYTRGWQIKNLEDGYGIQVLSMLFNFRIVRTEPGGGGYDRAWCYFGRDMETLNRALRAAVAWDGEDTTEPEGWNKRLIGPPGTQKEYR